MLLVYLIDIFEGSHNIVRDRFETDSVNVMKNRPLVPKKQEQILIYMNLTHSHQKTIEILTGNNNTQNARKSYWFVTKPLRNLISCKSIELMLLVTSNNVIKSS